MDMIRVYFDLFFTISSIVSCWYMCAFFHKLDAIDETCCEPIGEQQLFLLLVLLPEPPPAPDPPPDPWE